MKRIVLAALLGGLTMFVWEFVAHMALPLGETGMVIAPEPAQDAALNALRDNLREEGVYLLPGMTPEQWNDEAAAEAFSVAAANKPYAFVVYQPQGRHSMAAFPVSLGWQLLTDVLAALVVAWIVSLTVATFATRVFAAGAMGFFAWLVSAAPQWNWYRFPMDFTFVQLVMLLVGWLLAGVVIAWMLKPKVA